jgi:radical SAM protein with 4Fe4S-binding SPASM domain
LIDLKLDTLVISINFFSRELYKKYNGVDRLDEVVANTESFLRLKGARNPRTTLQILDIGENKDDIKKFFHFWKPRINGNDFIYAREFNDFCGTVNVAQFGIQRSPHRRYPCAQLFDHLLVNVDGDCFPCCMGINTNVSSALCLGNVKNSSLRELFGADGRIHEIRKMHRSGQFDRIDLCRQCDAWSYGPNIFFQIGKQWI